MARITVIDPHHVGNGLALVGPMEPQVGEIGLPRWRACIGRQHYFHHPGRRFGRYIDLGHVTPFGKIDIRRVSRHAAACHFPNHRKYHAGFNCAD